VINYASQRTFNKLQQVEYCSGELDKEEYLWNCWWARDLRPLSGCWVFMARVDELGMFVNRLRMGKGGDDLEIGY
jgi:hypothetical protein